MTGTAFVGRGRELEVLGHELARASAGELRCVFITGDAGVGKTRLARELLAADRPAVTRLQARGYPLGATAAYGMWVDALEPALHSASPETITALCGEFVDDLATILRPVAAIRGLPPPEGHGPRLTAGIERVLAGLCTRGTAIVVLDDLHLSDPSSVEVLRQLGRHRTRLPLLIVCTARRDDLTRREMTASVEFELEQDGLLTRLELPPLTTAAIGELAASFTGAAPPAALVHWLEQRSQGNPLYASGLIAALMEEGGDLRQPALRRLPEALADRVRFRLGQLSEPAQRILEYVAVAGRAVSLTELEMLTGFDPEILAIELDALVAARILAEDEVGRVLTYALIHALVQEAVYQDIGSARRRLLHRQIGRALAVTGRVSEAALHLARAAQVGDPEAVDILLVAIRQAESREAYGEVLELMAELVDLLPPGDERWRNAYDAIAWDAAWVVDHRADAHGAVAVAAMRAIDELFDATAEDPARRAKVKLRLGSFLAWGTGELDTAAQVLRAATTLFATAGDRRGELLSAREQAFVAGLRGDLRSMTDHSQRVLDEATAVGDRFVSMQALHTIGYAAMMSGRFDAAQTRLRAEIDIAVEEGWLYRAITALVTLGGSYATAGDLAAARECLDQAARMDPSARDSILPDAEIALDLLSGKVESAVAGAERSAVMSPSGPSLRRGVGMATGALAAIDADRPADADRFLARVTSNPAARGWSAFSALTVAAEGMRQVHAGRHTKGLVQLRRAAAQLTAADALGWLWLVLVEEVDAAAAAGEAALASAARDELDRVATELGGGAHRGLAAWAHGRCALLAGRREDAAASALEAVELLEQTGWQGQLARALHLLGRATPDRADAVALLERAAALYQRNGATWRRAQVLDDLSRLGKAGQRVVAAAAGPASLSRREREVAVLAATGLSAREIAAQLFVGERTVEAHLSRAYAKLGVSSKVELVRRAAQLGL